MENSFVKKILIGWLVFVSLYFIWGEYNHLRNAIARSAYTSGFTDAATKLLEESKKCQPIPINVGQQKTAVISVDCLNGGANKAADANTGAQVVEEDSDEDGDE